MPELPEVEVARRALTAWADGHRITAVHAADPGAIRTHLSTRPSDALAEGPTRLAAAIVGRRAHALRRIGKRLGWTFAGAETGLLLHLGMSGKWVRRDGTTPPRHGRLGLTVDDEATLWLIDPRRFGGVAPIATEALDDALGDGLGPDALDQPLDGEGLRDRLGGRRPIKVALLDQRAIAGLGNIHAAEALWRARIDPTTPCRDLDDAAWGRLADAILVQLRSVLAESSGDELTYVTEGGDGSIFAVYGHEGAPCRRCGGPIARTVQSGRGTWWCPTCQERPGRDSKAARSSR